MAESGAESSVCPSWFYRRHECVDEQNLFNRQLSLSRTHFTYLQFSQSRAASSDCTAAQKVPRMHMLVVSKPT